MSSETTQPGASNGQPTDLSHARTPPSTPLNAHTPPASVPLATNFGFNPWSREFVAYPYDVYARLRDEAPISFNPITGQYVFATHQHVNDLLREKRLGRTYLHMYTHEEFGRPDDPEMLEPFWTLVRNGMLDREPPDHTRLRRLVSKAFTPKMVESLRPRVEELAAQYVRNLLDAGSDGSVVDLKAIVAEPLPVTVIAEMLGVPEEGRPYLRPWSADICGMYELNPSDEAARIAVKACVEFTEYLVSLANERRKNPKDDLITALALVADEGDMLTDGELVGTAALLLNAGHEATVNTTVNGWHALFRHPAELARLRADHALVPSAVEELFRYDTPLQMFERWVLEDIEVDGVVIPRGVEVALLFGSANHDPAVFSTPAALDLGRETNPHISFGAGIHFCLGAPLARIELQASMRTLLEQVPGLAPAYSTEPGADHGGPSSTRRAGDLPLTDAGGAVWGPGYIIRGLDSLPVTLR